MSRSVEEAGDILRRQGFEFDVVGEGAVVTAQLPFPHANVASGTRVVIYAGEDAPKDTVTVPDLSGKSYAAAKRELETRGLFIRTAGALKSDTRATVSIQSVQAGREANYGAVVEVTLIDINAVELRRL
jgi:stage V sporulation protein D (sporulation-specific penicillin-binding protein)